MKNSIDNGITIIISHQEKILELLNEIIVLDKGDVKYFDKKEKSFTNILITKSVIKFCKKLNLNRKSMYEIQKKLLRKVADLNSIPILLYNLK